MIRRLLCSTLLASSLLTSGCYTLTMEVNSQHPVLVNQAKSAGAHFKQEEKAWYLLWGIVNMSPKVVDDMVGSRKRGAIQNFNVKTEIGVMDYLVTLVTLGIVMSRTVTVEGETK